MISADGTFFTYTFVMILFEELTCIIDQATSVNYKGSLQNAYIKLCQMRFFSLLFYPQRFLKPRIAVVGHRTTLVLTALKTAGFVEGGQTQTGQFNNGFQ